MKYIKKGRPPAMLRKWIQANSKLPGAEYGSHKFPKEEVRKALMKEQGSICAYTMLRISNDSSHIEHLKPQSLSRSEGRLEETFDYNNMVACYPATPKPGGAKVTFGAIQREDTWDAIEFLTPLNAGCELRFCYKADGQVQPSKTKDKPAVWTIHILKLNDKKLAEMRRAAIEEWGLSLTANQPVSRTTARRVKANMSCRSRDGLLHPFCVAIAIAAEEYVRLLDKIASKRKHAGNRKHGT